ncbi:MAG: sulfoacetate transporter [Robiginitomaculum sp.]|nr:MAG: sulfoacetate transporter [Robiginitomaculum sp.]
MKLALAFFVTAVLYASVGFGGGSTYTALLVLSGAPLTIIPIISLACNITVVSGNSVQYLRAKLISLSHIWPFLVFSVPMAWIGGRLEISETLFIGLLAISLFFAGITLLMKRTVEIKSKTSKSRLFNAIIGAGLGLLSGMVGIGGGIFLAPILHHTQWGNAKRIAAVCSLFILVNSISGLSGQLMKMETVEQINILQPYWLLLPMVLVGGSIGNRLSLKILSQTTIRKLTAILILFVALRLLWKFYTLSLS